MWHAVKPIGYARRFQKSKSALGLGDRYKHLRVMALASSSSMERPSVKRCEELMTAPGARLEMESKVIHGRSVRVWKNLPGSLRGFLLASLRTYAAREFIYDPTSSSSGFQRSTYQDIQTRALKLASWFLAQGLGKGSKVAIVGLNSTEWIVTFVAIHLIGGISVCVNAWLPVDSLVHCLRLTGPSIVFADRAIAHSLESCLPVLQVSGLQYLGALQSLDLLESPERSSEIIDGSATGPIEPEDDATIFFTSGTTGMPKAVLSTQRMALTNLFSSLVGPSRANLRANKPLPKAVTIADPQKAVLLAIPLFHVTGCLSFLFRAIGGGGRLVLLGKWDAALAVKLIKEERLTSAGGVPSVVNALLQSSALDRQTSLETLFFGGAPASSVLAERAALKFPKTALVQGYGLTETNAILCSVSGQDYNERPQSTGPPVPVSDIKIVDPTTGAPVATGSSGLVLVRGPQVMKEYYNDPVATREAIDLNGWFKTGDLGYIDDDGFLYLQDRLKDLIIRGGENIASTTVENALCDDPRISEAAAVAVPCEHLGERVAAVVSIVPGARVSEAELVHAIKPKLPYYAWPCIILVQTTPLARNPTGKLIKTELKKQAAAAWVARRRESKL